MGFITRLFDRKSAGNSAAIADQERSQALAGRETGQTADEQAATRGRMEAEMELQRARRQQPPTSNA